MGTMVLSEYMMATDVTSKCECELGVSVMVHLEQLVTGAYGVRPNGYWPHWPTLRATIGGNIYLLSHTPLSK